MTQTVLDASLDQLTQEFEQKRGALLRMKQDQETAARELAQLDSTKTAKAQAKAAALAQAEQERREVIAPSQQAFDTVATKAAAWLARMAQTEAQLHELCKEQHEILREYEQAAAHAGTLARALGTAGQFHFFDLELWKRVQIIPAGWPREVGNHYQVYVNEKQVYTSIRNSYRRGITGN